MPPMMDELPTKIVWARRGMLARFTPAIEAAFDRFQNRALLQRARWSAAIAAAVMSVYALMDIFMIPPAIMPAFLWVRGLFMILPLMSVWWLSYTDWGKRHLQVIGGLTATSSGLAVIAMLWIGRMNGTPIAYEGIILTMFYFYCCGGLRMKWSVLAGLVAGIVYPLAEAHAGMGTEDLVNRTIFLTSANVVGFVSAALMEHAARRNFAQHVQLTALSNADPLTDLLNRRALNSGLEALWGQAAQQGMELSVAMVDVDHFKAYNDEYGHAAGDDVLRRVAAVLRRHSAGPRDLAGRYGGEEFLCIWTTDTPPTLAARLKAIIEDVRAIGLPHIRSPLNHLSLSIGAVTITPRKGDDADMKMAQALRQADALLYMAKADGRNRALCARGWEALERRDAFEIPADLPITTIAGGTVAAKRLPRAVAG